MRRGGGVFIAVNVRVVHEEVRRSAHSGASKVAGRFSVDQTRVTSPSSVTFEGREGEGVIDVGTDVQVNCEGCGSCVVHCRNPPFQSGGSLFERVTLQLGLLYDNGHLAKVKSERPVSLCENTPGME